MSIVLVGSTSGSITLQEPAVAGTTVLNLPAVSGTIITTGSPQSGSVLQVVNVTDATERSSSSSTFADTGLTATITPKFATSKILVLVSQNGCGKQTNNTYIFLRLLRDSTTISNLERSGGYDNSANPNFFGSISTCYLDSPATTSSITYKTQYASGNNNAAVYVGAATGGVISMSTITLMEIAA